MKLLSLLLVIAMLFSITACGTILGKPILSNNGAHTSCTHAWNSATCTAPKTCSKCGNTSGEALGHTTESGTCTRCGETFSPWMIGEYVDEFEQPTGKKYIIADSIGTFSNSATTNSKLSASVQIDLSSIGIMLWEYDRNLVKGIFDHEDYDITILDDADTKHYFTGTIYKGGTRIYFSDRKRNAVLNLFRKNGSLKIHLKSSKYSISTYLFAVTTKGFSAAYREIQ